MIRCLSLCLVLCMACGTPGENSRPEDAVLSMFDSAQEGRVGEYLDFFIGDLRTSLEKNIADMSEQTFSDYLLSINEPIVGIAVSDVDSVMPGVVTLRVELVYRNKNEVQIYTLQQEKSGWKISDMTSAKRIKTIVPYGQKVFELAPDTTTDSAAQNPGPSNQ